VGAVNASRIYRQDKTAAGDPAVDFEDHATRLRIVSMYVRRDRPLQSNFDFADAILRDHRRRGWGECAGIDRVFNQRDRPARFSSANTYYDTVSQRERSLVKPKYPRAQSTDGFARRIARRNDIATLEENLLIERYSYGPASVRV
jgi:hypothetical protein